MIEEILKKGKIIPIHEKNGIGSTKEAHIAKLNGKKYLLRICQDKETAEKYKKYYNLFKKYGFFPKLIESKDNYLLFEFINGRMCKEKEEKQIIMQIGKICGIINKINAKNYSEREHKSFKKLDLIEKYKIISNEKSKEITNFYKNLSKKVKLKTSLDAGDVTNDNFMVLGKKVYFVDIEAIKPNIKGYGIAKAFTSWFKTEEERKAFTKAYNSVNSMKFYNADYHKLVTLIFFINRLKFKFEKGEKRIVKTTIKKLNKLLKEI